MLSCSCCRDLGDTFKWAFFGTTNTYTAIFSDAASNIVKGLDHDMPYFLTGDNDLRSSGMQMELSQSCA